MSRAALVAYMPSALAMGLTAIHPLKPVHELKPQLVT